MNIRLKRLPLFIGIFVFILVLFLTIQFLSNMLQTINKQTGRTSEYRIALLLEGPTYDQGRNSSAWESLHQLKEIHGFTLFVADNLQVADIAKTASSLGQQGYDLVFGHGVAFSKPFIEVAPNYPDTRFVTFNGKAIHPNQTNVRYEMRSAGYLVGMLAALMSESQKVGYIMVDKPTEYLQVEGFREGVTAVSPETSISIEKVPDFNDKESALLAARGMISEGVDVLYTTGDSFNLNVITEAQRANIYAIGYIADQRYMAPQHVISSLIQDVGKVYATMISQYLAGELPTGEVSYGLTEGVNRLGPFGPMVPETVKNRIYQELEHLIQEPQRQLKRRSRGQ
ncbi:BMP family ABC transporter substrate-binding protein [Brevibacillus humidisoli]|uniref:BMP family ABC transporter substrate-binding protein n=1 Tax=Brevibacillus humidisoli TaxID=2895522 RepID=UPI001E63EEF4|nr:BMP family ABC transporter substrate-binding protein [Brevibacillus humidisoli]UFJ39782.1 BMP family ABC transporter substrate-binding protein [Brevibacillus humidisoli]